MYRYADVQGNPYLFLYHGSIEILHARIPPWQNSYLNGQMLTKPLTAYTGNNDVVLCTSFSSSNILVLSLWCSTAGAAFPSFVAAAASVLDGDWWVCVPSLMVLCAKRSLPCRMPFSLSALQRDIYLRVDWEIKVPRSPSTVYMTRIFFLLQFNNRSDVMQKKSIDINGSCSAVHCPSRQVFWDDLRMFDWIKRKTDKYTSADMQNEVIQRQHHL